MEAVHMAVVVAVLMAVAVMQVEAVLVLMVVVVLMAVVVMEAEVVRMDHLMEAHKVAVTVVEALTDNHMVTAHMEEELK